MVFLVCFGASLLLRGRFFLANVGSTKLAHSLLNRLLIDELRNDLLSLLVNARSLESAINKGSSLSAVECEKLVGVSLNLVFGDLEDGFRNLFLVVLNRPLAGKPMAK